MEDKPIASDAELLRMPPKDYMNPRQREFFARLLIGLKEETQDAIEEAKRAIAAAGPEADELDRASVEEDNRQSMRFAERRYLLLRKIDRALARLHDGSYGYCDVTGEPIGLQRLLLRPTANLCTEEKIRQEQLERNFSKARGV